MKQPVFILSLFDTGFYTARLLRGAGIPVFGFDHDASNPGFYSKYLIPALVPHPQVDEAGLLNILLIKRKEFIEKPVLIAASESYLEFIQQNRTVLENNFLFLLPPAKTLKQIINKTGQFQLAKKCSINIPVFNVIKNDYDLEKTISQAVFPLIIKAVNQPLWKRIIREKAFITKDQNELKKIGQELLQKNLSFIAQEIIQGDCTNNFEFNALISNGKIKEYCIIKKIRQYPLLFGAATCVQLTKNDKVEKLGTKFLLENEIEGFSNTEFKIDPQTGEYYFIETNARVWQQIELTKKTGQNFVLAYYNLLTDNKQGGIAKYGFSSLRWVDLPTDLLLFFRFRKKLNLGFISYIKTIIGASSFGLFSLYDIKPFLKSIRIIK
jgi:predicted ATP-grasp superfamily ATP-dependent carboligase